MRGWGLGTRLYTPLPSPYPLRHSRDILFQALYRSHLLHLSLHTWQFHWDGGGCLVRDVRGVEDVVCAECFDHGNCSIFSFSRHFKKRSYIAGGLVAGRSVTGSLGDWLAGSSSDSLKGQQVLEALLTGCLSHDRTSGEHIVDCLFQGLHFRRFQLEPSLSQAFTNDKWICAALVKLAPHSMFLLLLELCLQSWEWCLYCASCRTAVFCLSWARAMLCAALVRYSSWMLMRTLVVSSFQ